jgi:hypothetical protein
MPDFDAQATAEQLHQRGLATAALFALEVGRPFALLGGQLLWVAQPTLALFGGGDWANRWAQRLEDPATLTNLHRELQTRP